jgi:hypothetical protein
MTRADKCIQSLTPLARADDPENVGIMQWYIASYMKDCRVDNASKITGLDELAEAVKREAWATQFAGHILDHINSGTASQANRALSNGCISASFVVKSRKNTREP